jgi:outer membrane protein assembly factor BamB
VTGNLRQAGVVEHSWKVDPTKKSDATFPIPESDDMLLVTNLSYVGSGLGVLRRLRPDGTEVWSVEAPGGIADTFLNGTFKGDVLSTFSWQCYLMEIDLATGAVISKVFTK